MRSLTAAKPLFVLVALAVLALGASPAMAGGCLDAGQDAFETCIDIFANANGGVVTAGQEATCSQFSATITNACVRQTKPDPHYVVCTRPYTVIIIFHDPGPNEILASFYGAYTCQ